MRKLYTKIKSLIKRFFILCILIASPIAFMMYGKGGYEQAKDFYRYLRRYYNGTHLPRIIEKFQDVVIERESIRTNYSKEEIEDIIEKWAFHYYIDAGLARAVASIESNIEPMRSRFEPKYYNSYIVSKKLKDFPKQWKGELKDEAGRMRAAMSVGVMQLMPYTAGRIAKDINMLDKIPTMNHLYDVEINIQLGMALLRKCLNRSKQFEDVAVCYNGALNRTKPNETFADYSSKWVYKVKERLANQTLNVKPLGQIIDKREPKKLVKKENKTRVEEMGEYEPMIIKPEIGG